jgi:hypothetical protein
MQQVMNQFPQTQGIGGLDIAGGLKEAKTTEFRNK